MKIKFLGHAAVLIEGNNFKALIDPFLKNNPVYQEDAQDILEITHIFITHAHGDHIGDSIEIAEKNDSLVICCAELAGIIRQRHPNIRLHPMHIGGTFVFDFGKVKMTPAIHGSAFRENGNSYYAGMASGFVISHEGKKLYHSGDTALTYDMKILENEEIDIAFLPIGGNYTMDIDDAVIAVDFIKPKITVPMHYNTFAMIKKDPNDFIKKLPNYKVVLMNSADTIEI